MIFQPQSNEPPSASFATLDTVNLHPVLDFDGAANESAVFSSVMPQHYASTTGVTVYLHFAVGGTSGNIDWDVAFERIGDQQQDINSDSFAAAISVDDTNVPGTTGLVDIVPVPLLNAEIDGIIIGDSFRIKVTRDAVSDTNTDDAQLVKVEIRET